MQKSLLKSKFLFSFLVLLFAQNFNAFAGEYDYPELMVTPKASDRTFSEASKEKNTRWTTLAPIQASAITTLAAAILQTPKDKNDTANGKSFGIAVGLGWLATTFALENFYNPYSTTAQEISKLPSNSQRDKLTRERMAEEGINAAASLGSRLAWISTSTNFLASVYLLSKVEKQSLSMAIDLLALATSFTPLIFETRWQTIARDQREYKKRIYGPVASVSLFQNPTTQKITPGLALRFSFN